MLIFLWFCIHELGITPQGRHYWFGYRFSPSSFVYTIKERYMLPLDYKNIECDESMARMVECYVKIDSFKYEQKYGIIVGTFLLETFDEFNKHFDMICTANEIIAIHEEL